MGEVQRSIVVFGRGFVIGGAETRFKIGDTFDRYSIATPSNL